MVIGEISTPEGSTVDPFEVLSLPRVPSSTGSECSSMPGSPHGSEPEREQVEGGSPTYQSTRRVTNPDNQDVHHDDFSPSTLDDDVLSESSDGPGCKENDKNKDDEDSNKNDKESDKGKSSLSKTEPLTVLITSTNSRQLLNVAAKNAADGGPNISVIYVAIGGVLSEHLARTGLVVTRGSPTIRNRTVPFRRSAAISLASSWLMRWYRTLQKC